jgi:hypothetical protein
MSIQVQRDTYLSLRAVLHNVGLRECSKRGFFTGAYGSIGVHCWTWLCIRKIEEMKKNGQWEGKVPNEATVRRRINYLASEEWIDEGIPRPPDEPPLWKHLHSQVKDVNPWKSLEVVEWQSGYAPREDGASSAQSPSPAFPPPTKGGSES